MADIRTRLIDIGFTALEGDIYLHLLQQGALTGYAIAKGIGKPVANTYKSIESLREKGAIDVSDAAKSRVCRAVPWQQFLKTRNEIWQKNLEDLSRSLEGLPKAEDDEAVYQLDNPDHVVSATVEAIDEAETVILADLEPAALSYFLKPLEAAAARGVEVRVKIYEPAEIEGAQITLRQHGKEVYAKTENIHFHVNSDGRQDVLALLSSDGSDVLQAFRTNSGLMNMKHYCALLYELILTDLKQQLRSGDIEVALKTLDDTDHLHPFSAEGPALKGFIEKYGQ